MIELLKRLDPRFLWRGHVLRRTEQAVRLQEYLMAQKDIAEHPGVVRYGHFTTHDPDMCSSVYYETWPLFLSGKIVSLAHDLGIRILKDLRPQVNQITGIVGVQSFGDTGALILANHLHSIRENSEPIFCIPVEHKVRRTGRDNELAFTDLSIDPRYEPYLRGGQVLIVDTVRQTGHTINRAASMAAHMGAKVIASATLVDYRLVRSLLPHVSVWPTPSELVRPRTKCRDCANGKPFDKF